MKEKTRKKIKLTIIILVIAIILSPLFFYLDVKLDSAIFSYNVVCNIPEEKYEEYGIVLLGSVSKNFNLSQEKQNDNIKENITIIESSNNSITTLQLNLDKNNEGYEKLLKHEYCHIKQFDKGNFGNCNSKKYTKILNEFQCYLAEDYPNWLYGKIYYPVENLKDRG